MRSYSLYATAHAGRLCIDKRKYFSSFHGEPAKDALMIVMIQSFVSNNVPPFSLQIWSAVYQLVFFKTSKALYLAEEEKTK